MSDLTEINEIVKRRYLTGDYGNAHLKVALNVWTEMRATVPSSGPSDGQPHLANPGRLGDILGIPVLVDHQLPPAMWRLVDNSSGNTLAEGRTDGAE
jgi:hypothetical protein